MGQSVSKRTVDSGILMTTSRDGQGWFAAGEDLGQTGAVLLRTLHAAGLKDEPSLLGFTNQSLSTSWGPLMCQTLYCGPEEY